MNASKVNLKILDMTIHRLNSQHIDPKPVLLKGIEEGFEKELKKRSIEDCLADFRSNLKFMQLLGQAGITIEEYEALAKKVKDGIDGKT